MPEQIYDRPDPDESASALRAGTADPTRVDSSVSRRMFIGGGVAVAGSALAVPAVAGFVGITPAEAAEPTPTPTAPAPSTSAPPGGSSRPAEQTRFSIHLEGVSALNLQWWFLHLADDSGAYWKPLAKGQNRSIEWLVNPREDAHQLIGSVFSSEQRITGGRFPNDTLRTLAYTGDYVSKPRSAVGLPSPLEPTLAMPEDYVAPYPTPPGGAIGGPPTTGGATGRDNGFNHHMVLLDGKGFAVGRILFSWCNTGNEDTAATAGTPYSIDLSVTFYQPWMEGPNRPPALSADGYYYSAAQINAIWAAWRQTFNGMPTQLPRWFAQDSQDDIARRNGWTVTCIVDTGVVEGVDSKMMVWWWNHAMGDEPGVAYTLWCPTAHYAIRWLPGYSPADILKSDEIPTGHVIPGTIYPDLQGGNLKQSGGGVMAYPVSMSPVPGRYKVIDPMAQITKAQVDNFATERFPEPANWLLHQWEDRANGLIHRSTSLRKLPLSAPATQTGYIFDHQHLEGSFWGSQSMRAAYRKWMTGRKSADR